MNVQCATRTNKAGKQTDLNILNNLIQTNILSFPIRIFVAVMITNIYGTALCNNIKVYKLEPNILLFYNLMINL